ncbi:hypothetical protein BY996DRAFT_6408065 [Phakopsora pachyrhizi]|nr:hypothetical protein BY996DRAFT_6408065 [Phakopsora pachyrhizi]
MSNYFLFLFKRYIQIFMFQKGEPVPNLNKDNLKKGWNSNKIKLRAFNCPNNTNPRLIGFCVSRSGKTSILATRGPGQATGSNDYVGCQGGTPTQLCCIRKKTGCVPPLP